VTTDGEYRQLMSVAYGSFITPELPYFTSVTAKETGRIERLYLHHIVAPTILEIVPAGNAEAIPVRSSQIVDIEGMAPGEPQTLTFVLSPAAFADPTLEYEVRFQFPPGEGAITLSSVELRSSGTPDQATHVLLDAPQSLALGEAFSATFGLATGAQPDQLVVTYSLDGPVSLAPVDLQLTLSTTPDMAQVLSQTDLTVQPQTETGGFTDGASFELGRLIRLDAGQTLYLQISLNSPGAITLLGSAVANETSWDLGLPLRVDGYDAFGGIYQGDLNFEMYWDANPDKLARMLGILERAEYVFISSSRQWASLPRIPERFPLASEYYRQLLGCPPGDSIEWCYNVAEVGTFDENLGFELVEIFETRPALGPLEFNDQPSEEAFTVYDHSKVFIFRKTADYDQQHVVDLLSAVDLSTVQRLTPKQASGSPEPTLMLPAEDVAGQRAGGTWSELFDTENWINASPWVSAVVWYVALFLLGLAVYPILRIALPGLLDGGYAFSRIAALLLLSWMGWFSASLGLPSTRLWLAIFALALVGLGAWAARPQLELMKAEWDAKRRRFIRVEVLFLIFFVLMLLIRLGNPDLWHPGKGGEKPMDFAYFNAVLKSTSFPPYDPWFSGGYINYYYYGFVLVGSLTKLLGIVPAVAYNLILPSLFAMLAVGIYSVVWNIWKAWLANRQRKSPVGAYFAGVVAAVGAVLIGNLGSLQMIFQGYLRLGAAGAPLESAGLLTRIGWMLSGFAQTLGGQALPFGIGDWYWNPTRLHPDVPIAEFPLFTFTYADLHAHMIALPVTMLALAWALSALLSRAWEGRRNALYIGVSFLVGGITIGSLRPTNTWDFPTYLALGVLAVAAATWLYWPRPKNAEGQPSLPLLPVLGGVALLGAISVFAYQPFAEWYSQGYASLRLWDGGRTTSGTYLVHWGFLLFILIGWMAWETRQWMAQTPLSALNKIKPYRGVIYVALAALVAVVIGLQIWGIHVAWLVLPLMVWAALLILRPGQDAMKRLVLFLIGTGLFLSVMVEVVVLSGDIGRMNTVFKFYLQVWLLFSVAGALALAWIWDEFEQWSDGWRRGWQLIGTALLASVALFMMLGVTAKIQDRMAPEAPHSLDGMAYMEYALYYDQGQELHLEEDYAAIRWLQENVQGSPVIVEAQVVEYRWGSRISVNTGLPAVLGWNWHQRQQREFVPGNDIWARAEDITAFYSGGERDEIVAFLQKYDVRYIILGELERAYYPQPGILKFGAWEGVLWEEVFRIDDTVIYRVLDSTLLAGN
jgi:YYY domain-containing protein